MEGRRCYNCGLRGECAAQGLYQGGQVHDSLLRQDSQCYGTGRAPQLRQRRRTSTSGIMPPAGSLSNIPAGDLALQAAWGGMRPGVV